MKKKIFTGIVTAVLAFTAVFAGCTENPGANTPNGTDEYTVTFNAGSGTVTPESAKVKKGGKVSEPTASYTGYSLEGWYEESAYTNKWVFSDKTVESDITLYAKWTANSYNVTLDVNGGAELQNTVQSVTYGEPFNFGITTKSGYNFDGWTYNNVLITDRNGKGKNVWLIADNVTVSAKWTEDVVQGSDDVTGLIAAIEDMGHNYTASVYDNNNYTLAYEKISTEQGIYKKAASEYASSGILFDSSGEYVYEFKVRGGKTVIESEPSKKADGTFYTRADVYASEYLASVINPQAYVFQGNGVYACRSEYRNQQGSAILGKTGSAERIYVTVENGKISRISIDNFLDNDIGKEDTIEIEFSKIGSSSIESYISGSGSSGSHELPSSTDPSKPTAPSSIGSSVKPVDTMTEDNYVNGANDSALPALKSAIDAAREDVCYVVEDTIVDNYYHKTTKYKYKLHFNGYKLHITNYNGANNSYKSDGYYIQSDGKAYKVFYENGVLSYTKYNYYTFDSQAISLGGNLFNKLNASMFEQSATDSNVYTAKASSLTTTGDSVFTPACGVNDLYSYTDNKPSISYGSITLTLKDGKIAKIEASREFVFMNSDNDQQTLTVTLDHEDKLEMPYESEDNNIKYSDDELVLKNAIEATGSNYTLDLQYYDSWHVIEYYADNGIWKWYVDNLWGSSGYVYINDYAYYFTVDTQNGNTLVVDDEIYEWNDGPEETDGKYYRAWMNKYYLPIAQLDPRDFTRTGEKVFELKSSALRKYDRLFFDFSEENGLESMKVFLDDEGRIEKIECYNNYLGTDAAYASIVYVGDIGTTEILFLF